MITTQIALKLIEFCKNKEFSQAREKLYAEDAVSIEADNTATTGLKALAEKEKYWLGTVDAIHAIDFSAPLVNGNFFSIAITWDLTYTGKERVIWKEIAVFEVREEKVVFEKFYY